MRIRILSVGVGLVLLVSLGGLWAYHSWYVSPPCSQAPIGYSGEIPEGAIVLGASDNGSTTHLSLGQTLFVELDCSKTEWYGYPTISGEGLSELTVGIDSNNNAYGSFLAEKAGRTFMNAPGNGPHWDFHIPHSLVGSNLGGVGWSVDIIVK